MSLKRLQYKHNQSNAPGEPGTPYNIYTIMANLVIEKSTLTISHEITKDEILELVKQADFSAPEKLKILDILFPQRGYNDKARLAGEISAFIFNQ